ncbi:MAG TPA: carbon-nitrogen hydrolase family protein [Fimbriimonas sp.]
MSLLDDRIRIGMGQMRVEGGALDENLARAVEMIEAASGEGCDLLVLPECLDAGWTDPSARTIASPIPGGTSRVLSCAAREHGLYLVAGITERQQESIFNTAVLIGPDGAILGKHRKINELEIAMGLYGLGSGLHAAHTPIGTIGLTICADNAPGSLHFAHSLARMGVQLFPSPCAWAVDGDHDNRTDPYGEMWLTAYWQIARRYRATVVGVSNVGPITGGPWAGRKCIGCSLAIGPDGEVLAQGAYDVEDLIAFDATLCPVTGWGTGFGPT